ncbi:peptidoglycan-binding protein [Pedobacter steynii]|uniref:Peptidoglycan-binding protein n=1 Tax=Pedobacter steynii TaxID=430522 RepID=A0A1D7QD82_9SPHI|nr:peptidoglycan-binding protein [Pedobacter steynii]AOM76539.1 peptidoglycan-binding protein [Pedobacter steynii]
MAAIRILFSFVCLAFISSFDEPNSDLLNRKKLITIAESQLGVREKTGNNDGLQVEEYLKTVNLKKGNPYCAAFISWVFYKAGFDQPRTGWSPALFQNSHLIMASSKEAYLPGNLIGIYFPSLKRIAHVGIIAYRKNNWIISIEANTNVEGSREGDGVYRRRRPIRTISRYSDWINNWSLKRKGGASWK